MAKPKSNSNSRHPNARPGNKNAKGNPGGPGAPKGNKFAKGNRGGPGGPQGNKKAVRTHEFETFRYSDLDAATKKFLSLDDCFADKFYQQILLIKDLSLREVLIQRDIQLLRSAPDTLLIDSVTNNAGATTISSKKRNKAGEEWDGSSTTEAVDSISTVTRTPLDRLLALEAALSRVQSLKQRALEVMHRMEVDAERLEFDRSKLQFKVQLLAGLIDLDEVLGTSHTGMVLRE